MPIGDRIKQLRKEHNDALVAKNRLKALAGGIS